MLALVVYFVLFACLIIFLCIKEKKTICLYLQIQRMLVRVLFNITCYHVNAINVTYARLCFLIPQSIYKTRM